MNTIEAQLHDRIERIDGPALIAYWNQGEATSEHLHGSHEYGWHSHIRGQFYCVVSGLLRVRTAEGSWLLPPHRAGWMPPGVEHTVSLSGSMSGWGVFITPDRCRDLPTQPCVIGISELLRALVRRASLWAWEERLSGEQERVLEVLLDEIRHAPHEQLHLPVPSDRRLLRIVYAVLEQPHDNRSLEDWATWAGLSARTLSRLFRQETSLSFAQWRQQARLTQALERLADGESVTTVADSLGYASPSAFVAMFRRCFGQPPARYFASRPAAVGALA